MGSPEIKQAIEKIIDNDGITKEDVDFLKTLQSEKQKENVILFLQEEGNKSFYTNAVPKINQALNNYLADVSCDDDTANSIRDFITSLQSSSETTEVKNITMGNKINTLVKESGDTNINTLLTKEKTSLGQIFEESSEAIRNNLFSLMTGELLKDPYLSKEIKNNSPTALANGNFMTNDGKRELTETGEEIKKMLEKEVSKERSDNITFGLLDAVIKKVEGGRATIKDNKEKIVEEKASLLFTIQKLMKNGGLATLGNNPGIIKNMDASWNTIQDFQKNFKIFLKEKVKQAGLDLTDMKSKKKSILAGSDYSVIGLALSNDKRNETVKKVVGNGFKEGFSYFNNFENTKQLMQSLVGVGGKKFDINTLPENNKIESKPTDDDLKSFVKNMNELVKDMPKDPTSLEAQQLKEKVMNNKMDQIMNQFGPLKDFILPILERLNSKGGKGILGFLAKALGLKEGDIQKLLDRPYIKSGVDEYKNSILEGQKQSSREQKRMKISSDTKKWETKTTYYKLANDIVYRQNDENKRVFSRVNKEGEVKDLDKTNKEDIKVLKNYEKVRDGYVEDFAMHDINTTDIVTCLQKTLASKFLRNEKSENYQTQKNKVLSVQNKYATISADGKIITPNEEIIKNSIKNILENNIYVYSTDDLIGAIIQEGVNEVNKIPEKQDITIQGKKDIAMKKGDTIPADIGSWIATGNLPAGTTYTLQDPKPDFSNSIPEKAIIIVTTPEGKTQNVEVTFKETNISNQTKKGIKKTETTTKIKSNKTGNKK